MISYLKSTLAQYRVDPSLLVRMSMMQDYVFNIVRRSVCPSVDFVYGESYGSPYYSSLVYEWWQGWLHPMILLVHWASEKNVNFQVKVTDLVMTKWSCWNAKEIISMIMSFRSRAIRSRDENLESLEQFPDEGEIFQVFDQHKRLDKFDQQHHKQLNDKTKVRTKKYSHSIPYSIDREAIAF